MTISTVPQVPNYSKIARRDSPHSVIRWQGLFFPGALSVKASEAVSDSSSARAFNAPFIRSSVGSMGIRAALDDAAGYSPLSSNTSATRWAIRSFLASEDVAGAVVRRHVLPSLPVWTDAFPLLNR